MPSIYLGKQSGYYYASSLVTVTVKQETYLKSFFKKSIHTIETPKEGTIWLYKSSYNIFDFWSKYATLQPGEDYRDSKLQYAEVYFNPFDKTNTALVCLLKFNNGKNFIYQDSQHGHYIDGGSYANITSLTELKSGENILDAVLKENDKLDNILTYNIGRKEGDPPNGGGNGGSTNQYNNKKIQIEDDTSKGEPKLTDGFKRFKHTPAGGNESKKACVIWNKNVLLQQGGTTEVKGIQEQVYTSIVVYYGKRAKKTSIVGGKLIEVPLLIELTKKDPPNEPDYYVHKKSNSGGSPQFYWEPLQGDSGGKTLKDLLVDMGFGMNRGDNGYEQLKQILSAAGVNGVGDGVNLSTKVEEVKGDKLQTMLGLKVGDGGPGSQKTFLQLLLTQIEFDLLDSVVILLKKNTGDSQYGDGDVSGVVSQLQPQRTINRVNMSGKNIKVSNETARSNGQCVQKYGYKLIKHDITEVTRDLGGAGQSQLGIRFIIQSESSASHYKQLKLYDKDKPDPQNLQYTYYDNSNKDVYVYFYGEHDPRPLLVCYNGCAYKPRKLKDPMQVRQVIVEYSEWVKIDNITQCTCSGAGTTDPNQQILDALNDVVGFLNPVQLNPKQIPGSASGTITGGTGESPLKAQYDLHTYIPGTTIKIGITRKDVGCYDKYTYQPYGTNGQGTNQRDDGFRLGTVLYTKTRQSGLHSRLDYTTQSTTNKYHPVLGVTVYYYDKDSNYDDPLLIELEFKKNGGGDGGTSNEKEYYKLTQLGEDSGGTLKWAIDKDAKGAVSSDGDNQKLIEHLDGIRHLLKPVVKILLDKTEQYALNLSIEKGTGASTYSQHNGGTNTITVDEYSENGCNKLKTAGYVCYQHKVSQINSGTGFNYNDIGGLKFFISGTNGEGANDIEIPLYGDNGDQLPQITYNKCMGDVYVFFYCKPGGDQGCKGPSNNPTAPLMLYYNKGYYRPESIDNYFQKWVCEKGITGTSEKPCGDNNGTPLNYQTLATRLDTVNKSLNRIKLTETSFTGGSASLTYGIPEPSGVPPDNPNIELNRIKVTQMQNKTPNTRPYCKLVHRTINAFDIGEIWYNKNITEGSVQINGSGSGDSIKVDNGGTGDHTSFLSTGSNKPNTVVAYYHTEDKTHTLPQLIVLLQTDEEIRDGDEPITSKAQTKYGYYVLSTGDSGHGYKYEWRQPVDTGTTLTLDDATEFKLLNSLVILVEQQKQYEENAIKNALINSKSIRSPGNTEGVNRLKDRQITIGDKTTDNGKCVSKYGYKLLEHDLTKATEKIHGIKPILGLRFLIPSKSSATEYKQITLYKEETTIPQNIEYIYFDGTNKTLYVYFYGEDPRPLLLCYSKNAYIPKKQNESTQDKPVDVAYKKWTKVKQITKCACDNGLTESSTNVILEALLKVALFLNPVQINPKQIPERASGVITTSPSSTEYNLHKFTFNHTVKIKITRESVECYEKYTYEPAGTSKDGAGFRLGNVIYHENRTGASTHKGTLEYTTKGQYKHHPLVKVTVYYYDHDKQYNDPLLIELDFNVNWYVETTHEKEYWKLTKNDGPAPGNMKWDKDPDAKDQIGPSDTDNKKLITYLDTIRYQFKKLVRIEIQHNLEKQYDLKARPGSGSAGSGFAQILPSKKIQVTQCDDGACTKLKESNYACFKHTLTGLQDQDHHQIGGVVMTLPSKNSDTNAVEIPIFDSNDQQKQLYYNSCMNDLIVHVYFYFITRTSQVDQVPLMLCYNSNYYKPIDRDDYLHLWHHEPSLNSAEPCKKVDMIKAHLDLINTELNRIDLTHKITSGSTSQYGIPSTQARPEIDSAFNLNRIQVTKIPTVAKPERPYVKLIHRTVNDFRFGEIWYDQDIIKNSVIIKKNGATNGSTIISVNRLKNHNLFINVNEMTNTVVVYYSTTDTKHILPQLILLMTTEKPIEPGTAPVTATTGTSYGYYIINHSDGICSYLKYDWREPKEKQTPDAPLKLDEETEFSLFNAVVILMERKKTKSGPLTNKNYGDNDITAALEKAIESGTLKPSPCLDNDINRLKNKKVTLHDATSQPLNTSLNIAGFRVIKHDFTNIVNLDKIDSQIRLIAGLRFLIPTAMAGEYTVLNLYESTATDTPLILYHQKEQESVCVYFYGGYIGTDKGDPRPLLLCYNKQAFRAPNILYYDLQQWYKGSRITECPCDKDNGKNLLIALVHVSNYLNRVQIGRGSSGPYTVHKFNGMDIIINLKITKGENKFCYDKYTHTHKGMKKSTENGENPKSTEGPSAVQPAQGFRLGRIDYGNSCIKDVTKPSSCIDSLISQTSKFEQSSEIVVYYYLGDKTYQNPLLIALKNNSGSYKPYYELLRDSIDNRRKYKKEDKTIDLDTTKGGQLETILDRILFSISKRLQILLNKRPDPIQLCPIERKRIKFVRSNKAFDQPTYTEMGYQLITDAIFGAAEISQYIVDEGLLKYKNPKNYPYINEKNCEKRQKDEWDPKITTRIPTYPARVYGSDGKRDSDPNKTRNIKVQKIESKELANTGYHCYRHILRDIADIDNFGGLRLFLWDNRPDSDDSDCKPTSPTTNTKPKCCELDLYENGTQPSSTSCTKKIHPVAYTTCKGDLYVYFYGSDPRPMLLCYNGQSYAPQSMDDYNKKWCLVKQIKSCECSDSGFQASQDLLNTLYKTSMFLNPVRLWETLNAYQVVKPEVTRMRKDKKDGKEVPKITSLPAYVYKVQTFGDTDINIKVKSADLNCYRQYTFESAMGDRGSSVRRDYRLGDIYYGEGNTRGADSTCLKYPQNQRLQSVSLYYYMYDSEHRYPLIIQLDYGFGGELDDYFRVCKIGEGAQGPGGGSSNGNGGGPGGGASGPAAPPTPSAAEIAKKITWVKLKCPVTDKDGDQDGHGKGHVHSESQGQTGSASVSSSSSGTTNCNDDCKSPTDYTGKKLEDETVKELKENDSRFVKHAHMVQGKIRDLSQGDPTYGKWYMDVSSLFNHYYMDYVAELQQLIEARCFDVRRKYAIKYEKGEENKNLILVTDENCYEESIMGYVLGGGALGVAGGGGWKLATFVLTLFIKV